jgi:predicted nucleic-acid-binding protein
VRRYTKKNMRAVDTKVLVRLVTRDDRKQVAAAESFVSKVAWVSTLVLMEATWVLTAVYDLTHAEIARAIDMLLHYRDLTIQESDSMAAALEQYRNRPALGFSGCLILETARKAGHLPLGTFDRNLSNPTEPKDCSCIPVGPSGKVSCPP